MMGINVDLLQWSINFLMKKLLVALENEIISNKELAEELHKPVIRKFNKKKYNNFLLTTFGAQI